MSNETLKGLGAEFVDHFGGEMIGSVINKIPKVGNHKVSETKNAVIAMTNLVTNAVKQIATSSCSNDCSNSQTSSTYKITVTAK